VTVSIADLDGLLLAMASERAITLDANAAGWGWSSAGGGMDLLTAVLHELGHVLGYEHGDADRAGLSFMAGDLAPSQRVMGRAQVPVAPRPVVRAPVLSIASAARAAELERTPDGGSNVAVGSVPTIERRDPRADVVRQAPVGFDLTALVRAAMALLILAIVARVTDDRGRSREHGPPGGRPAS
jgi:hypothetical protein